MINETPIEILELPARLRTLFTGKVPEATSCIEEARETNFLSRALAAYAIHRLSGCSIEDAAASVVDGGAMGASMPFFMYQQIRRCLSFSLNILSVDAESQI